MNDALSYLAHDVRNIAAAISLDAERLTLSDDSDQNAHGHRTLKRISAMIDICNKAIGAGTAQHNSCFDDGVADDSFADLLLDVLNAIPQQNNPVDIRLNCPPDLAVNTCATRLFRLIFNLVNNASSAVQAQGDGIVQITVSTYADDVHVEISDNGPGLPESVMSQFGHRPTLTKLKNGHGLGISVAQQMAADLKAQLTLIKSDAQGTAYCITIPTSVPVMDNEPFTIASSMPALRV